MAIRKRKGKHIAVLPDVQMKPGVSPAFLSNIGRYFADKKPDIIVCLGDFADIPSLSSYDKGKKSFNGRRYLNDLLAAEGGMEAFMDPIIQEREATGWDPKLVFLMGNHEVRPDRVVEFQEEYEGMVGTFQLERLYEHYGWEVVPFLEVVDIEGVMFSHYFTSGVMGRPVTTAGALLAKKHMSCIAGHQQGKQIAYATCADGRTITGMIVGSCYEHDEEYLGPQGNKHWRGIVMLHEVNRGAFDEMFVSLQFLNEKYEGK